MVPALTGGVLASLSLVSCGHDTWQDVTIACPPRLVHASRVYYARDIVEPLPSGSPAGTWRTSFCEDEPEATARVWQIQGLSPRLAVVAYADGARRLYAVEAMSDMRLCEKLDLACASESPQTP